MNQNKKINVAVVFGGRSGEHEVSLMSAASIIKAMDKEKYNVLPLGITKKGYWMYYNGPIEKIESGEWEEIARQSLKENPKDHLFFVVSLGKEKLDDSDMFIPSSLRDKVDVIFPVLHGPYGEDGTIQGLFEMADIPYVGAGVLASAVGMDKIYTKKILQFAKLPVGDYYVITRKRLKESKQEEIEQLEKKFGYPVFIKPANLGSSVGITKAHNRKELIEGLEEAAQYDRKILVEAFINGREIECAVLGNEEPQASIVGEILPSHEFYDYHAKYSSSEESKLLIPADIPEDKVAEIQEMAIKAYQSIDCTGLARVDFFLEKDTMKIYINEMNTLPGFTKYSMYPLLWEATGLPYDQLIDRLIELAMENYKDRNNEKIQK